MSSTICKICKKDHKIKNEGPLTVCERKGYLSHGALQKTKNERVFGFGIGQERFQHSGAK